MEWSKIKNVNYWQKWMNNRKTVAIYFKTLWTR
jgi:hypothetical protein